VDLSRRAALRATLFGLHTGAVFAGTECVLIWAAFRWTPAAIVGGLAYVVGGVLALLAYPRRFARTRRVILERGLRVYVYSMALIIVGALLVRDGSRSDAVGRIKAESAREGFGEVFPELQEGLVSSERFGANGHAYGIIKRKRSGRRDLNPRQRAPKARALPDCATPRTGPLARPRRRA
jgi:hypothetical protein